MKNNPELRKIAKYVGIAALVLLILGIIKVMFPVIIIGLVLYVVYCFLRGPRP